MPRKRSAFLKSIKFALPVLLLGALARAAPPFDTVLYGAAYYPEYMPYERADRDIELMKKAGFTVVRVGESTWTSWEPRDGEFHFDWMDRVLDKLHAAGLKVIFGTPTYSIPPWLYKKHPDILVTRNTTAPPLSDPHEPTYPGSAPPGAYGPRQNMDLTHPQYRRHCERIIRKLLEHYRNHPAIIGYQVDNETGPNGLPLPHVQEAFVERLKQKYGSPETLNKAWGLVYWDSLFNPEELPSRDGILNPGYKLEWERFQQDIVTEFLAWQAKIVREYKLPGQFITHDFIGGIRPSLNQKAIAAVLDVVAVNPYHTMQDRFGWSAISLSGDWNRSLKQQPYLVTETNAQGIGWDSRAQYPPYDGQLRLAAYFHIASGATMVAYWHWHSLHYGQETYWRGVLGHDLEPNRVYAEVSRIGAELKRLGPDLAVLRKENPVAILVSTDSHHALRFMPFSDRENYLTALQRMHSAVHAWNLEPDFITPEDADWTRYKVLLVPPLYAASDALLNRISAYVRNGGHVLMALKSGYANEHSTVRWTMAPGPLREAAGIRYQEFTSLARPVPLSDRSEATAWAEFLIPETAEAVLRYQNDFLGQYPAVTRNMFGKGSLTYEGTVLSLDSERVILGGILQRAGTETPDAAAPAAVKVRHGRNARGEMLHFYLNVSGNRVEFPYRYRAGRELIAGQPVARAAVLTLPPWGVAVIAEGR